ncbi:MAG: SDR family oxidoreductase [Chitinophagaceae bacterium]|nr:MAG: SDR family oxidoreductase [Chitinophagaceae bacterium]
MIIKLKGKFALVGGGSKGIGLATAQALAEAGASVTILARNSDDLEIACKNLPKVHDGQTHFWISADSSAPDTFIEKVKNFSAEKKIHFDILVNNTGGPPGGPITDASAESFLEAYNNHLICNHLLVQTYLEGMKKAAYGRIINIISTSVKQPLPNLGVSNTTRAAVAAWAKTLANETAMHGITVNNVLPGATETDRLTSIILNKSKKENKTTVQVAEAMKSGIPMKRFGKAQEVASLVCFLASQQASYITGTTTPVDGGRTSCF